MEHQGVLAVHIGKDPLGQAVALGVVARERCGVQCPVPRLGGLALPGARDPLTARGIGAGVLGGLVECVQVLVAYAILGFLQLGHARAQVGAKAREDALADVGVGVQGAQGRAELGHHLLVGGLGQQQLQGGDLGGAGVGGCCLGAGGASGWVLGGDLQGFGVSKVDAQPCCVLRGDQQRLGLCLHHQGQCGAGGVVGGGEEGGAGQGRVSVGVGLAIAAWAAVGEGASVVLGLVCIAVECTARSGRAGQVARGGGVGGG